MNVSIEQRQQALAAEKARVEERLGRLAQQAKECRDRLDAIRREQHRLTIESAVGQPGAVKIRVRYPPGHRRAYLNDRTGTVLKVSRKNAEVDFGDDRPWIWTIWDLVLASEPQAFTLAIS
jgi:hypothetical protein